MGNPIRLGFSRERPRIGHSSAGRGFIAAEVISIDRHERGGWRFLVLSRVWRVLHVARRVERVWRKMWRRRLEIDLRSTLATGG